MELRNLVRSIAASESTLALQNQPMEVNSRCRKELDHSLSYKAFHCVCRFPTIEKTESQGLTSLAIVSRFLSFSILSLPPLSHLISLSLVSLASGSVRSLSSSRLMLSRLRVPLISLQRPKIKDQRSNNCHAQKTRKEYHNSGNYLTTQIQLLEVNSRSRTELDNSLSLRFG